MGNKPQKPPSYQFFGVLFGQMFQYKNFTKEIPEHKKSEFHANDLSNKKYLVTGASSGLGKDICKLLLQQNAHVIMVSRSMDNLQKAQDDISLQLPDIQNLDSQIQKEVLDLGDIQSVIDFTKKIQENETKLDGIINNGGALPVKQVFRKFKDQEIEETIAVHVVSPFIICQQLHPLLSETNGRILNNTSGGAYTQRLNMTFVQNNFDVCCKEEIQESDGEQKQYHDGSVVYAQCKRAMIEMTDLMAAEVGNDVKVVSVHPGWCETPGLKTLYEQQPSYESIKFRESIDGAYGIVYSLVQKDLVNGEFYLDGDVQPKHKALANTQIDQAVKDQLWYYCQSFLQ